MRACWPTAVERMGVVQLLRGLSNLCWRDIIGISVCGWSMVVLDIAKCY